MKTSVRLRLVFCLVGLVAVLPAAFAARWTPERANAWWAQQPFRAGGNYVPSTAINQLEMWQPESFDPATIDRELGWAQEIGFNTMRVFLHNLPWREDPAGYLERIDTYLRIADKHGIATLFVIFDSVWDPEPRSGPQHAPTPGVHNSGWVQSPGRALLIDGTAHGELKAYVKAVLTRFKDDRRVLGWDLFNEPDNPNRGSYDRTETAYKAEYALILLKEVFAWAREVDPSQPLTVGVWQGQWEGDQRSAVTALSLDNSDVISFHSYEPPETLRRSIEVLKRYGRPLLCTEYMARPRGSRFETNLPVLKENKVAAIAWGFVAGKSQTNYPWDSWAKPYATEPPEWFHDVLRSDGSAYRPDEVAFLKRVLKAP